MNDDDDGAARAVCASGPGLDLEKPRLGHGPLVQVPAACWSCFQTRRGTELVHWSVWSASLACIMLARLQRARVEIQTELAFAGPCPS